VKAAWLEHKIPPPVVALLVAVAMWFAASLGPSLPIGGAARQMVVALLVAAGLAFDLSGLWAFRSARTTINPLAPARATALVTHGVYRLTRNPMYLGLCCFLLAWASHLAAWMAFLGPVAFVFYITRFQIVPEERALRRLFGDAFDRYAARVRRWL
jgi:protein-S-isoprenylcysteine O-methyltransferase Ste14